MRSSHKKHDLNRRDFIKNASLTTASITLAGQLGCAVTGTQHAPTAKKPNVILVMTDDQGYGDLGCHGNSAIKTPNLDHLYKQSIRLTNFHVDPTCSPTRSALLTGRYSSRTGVWHTIMGRSLLQKDEITMADIFARSGYQTAIFGKWHLGDNYPFRPQDKGFQEVLVHGGGGVGQTPDYFGNDYFDDTYLHNGKWKKYKGYCTDVWFDGALKFIRKNKNKPFFCYISTNAPHGPYHVAEKYSKPYKLNKNVPNPNFNGMITNIDDNMKRLLDHIDTLGLTDHTVLVFMTDNGTAAGVQTARDHTVVKGYSANMRGKKGSVYEGGHRVPCFIRYPGPKLKPPGDIHTLTAHIDLLPTFIDLCRLDKPHGLKLDGTSLLPLLSLKPGRLGDRTLFVHSQRIENPQKGRNITVMTNRWRLVNQKQLYDVAADPAQINDLAADHPQTVAALQKAYDRWYDDISGRFNEYSRTIIGSPKENPTTLTCHDWHGPIVPWSQSAIRKGLRANGFWALEIERDGTYRFELRRWPVELNAPIDHAPTGAKKINPNKARLTIAQHDAYTYIPPGALSATFLLPLKATHKAKLKTWFVDNDRTSRGAFYVYITRLA